MKNLILVILIFPFLAFGSNYFPVGKSGAKTTYTNQQNCKTKESWLFCPEISGKDLRKWKSGFRAIDIDKTLDCTDSVDCIAKSIGQTPQFSCDPNDNSPVYDDKINWPALNFAAKSRPVTGWFLWCQKEILVVDAAGILAANTADGLKADEKTARDLARIVRKINLQTCVQDSKVPMTPLQSDACIKALVREVLGSRVNQADL